MKYPNWGEYDNAKKWKAVADEVNLETNNATTKADLTNMVKFLGREAARLQAEVYKLKAVADAAREFFEGTGCEPKECKKCDPKYINFCERSRIGQALAELDKEER